MVSREGEIETKQLEACSITLVDQAAGIQMSSVREPFMASVYRISTENSLYNHHTFHTAWRVIES